MKKNGLNKETLTILVVKATNKIFCDTKDENCEENAKLEDHFYGDLYFDSLDKVNLESILEENIYDCTGKAVDLQILEEFWMVTNDPSVQDLVNYLAEKLNVR